MNMIQLLLLVATIAALVLYLRFFRSLVRDRLIALSFALVSIAAILFPNLTTSVAVALGVGRGTDLVFYLFAAASSFVFILLYGKITALEERQTELVRALAIGHATPPAER
jgi:small membrane protein